MYTQYNSTHCSTARQAFPLVMLCAWLLFATPALAESVVTNTVSVSANGSGENSTSVTTIINGEIVEDWSETSPDPITHTSSFATTTTQVSTEVTSNPQSLEHDQLVELIAHLQTLIALYVSLLTS